MRKQLSYIFIFLVFSSSLAAKVDNMFNGQTSIKQPFKLRDPFQAPKFKSERNKKIKQRTMGILNNIKKLNAPYDIENIQIVGVLIGKERRVFVRLKGEEETFTLKEGEEFGNKGPQIRAILPGGVILVEKITNIYGEDEYIETVVPISK